MKKLVAKRQPTLFKLKKTFAQEKTEEALCLSFEIDNSTIVEIFDATFVSRATESGAIEQV